MKRSMFLILIVCLFFIPVNVLAQRGCCSHHGGVAGCNSNGRQVCKDGSLSPSCTCTPTVQNIYGCTDSKAKNYNSNANKDNGTCEYYVYGCTDQTAKNYNVNAEIDDGTCEYEIVSSTNITSEKEYKSDLQIENDENVEIEQNESEDDNSAALFLISGGALTTYLYRKRKK